MTPEQAALIKKAQESLRGARLLAKDELYDFAASRAYYAMFYIAEAFLLEEKVAYSKHSGSGVRGSGVIFDILTSSPRKSLSLDSLRSRRLRALSLRSKGPRARTHSHPVDRVVRSKTSKPPSNDSELGKDVLAAKSDKVLTGNSTLRTVHQ